MRHVETNLTYLITQLGFDCQTGKAWKRQIPFRNDDGLFEEDFIEDRRKGLETFVNKVAGHPLAQNERCLHMFLQEPVIDRNYVPGKIRNP